ncbi:hypothetical protein [Amycolatopsis suaedae]|uniref:TIR domain-containing protein n=1 Tax=Amycolatopsis suaedae TaxID=2510978 RepID=A0A4Q7JA93_9PSEU|nr:hypothetical protein [Amycolatopsis suaedae]RZQ63383.1 hypothetical protein EWH70_13090 [Amycolatopsis suaedae]
MTEAETYDIVVSFAEEQRSTVEEIVEACRQSGLTVLHGPDQTHEWWARKDAGDLPDARVLFFLPFVSEVDDFSSAMLRAVKNGDEHVLPVLLGEVPAELLHPHVTYLRTAEHRPDELAEALSSRIEAAEAAGLKPAAASRVVTAARETAPEPAIPASFSRYAEQDAALRYLGAQFAAAVPKLERRGFVGTVHVADAQIAVRVERAGDTIYALDIQRGGIGGDETLNFVVGRHDAGSVCSNGWARPVYAAGSGALELHDLSLLGGSTEHRLYSTEELFTALWQRIENTTR